METAKISKPRPTSKTVMFSSIFFAIAVCFVALIHVEIVLRTHRHTLQVLSREREANAELRNAVHRHEAAFDLILRVFHSNSHESKLGYTVNLTFKRLTLPSQNRAIFQ